MLSADALAARLRSALPGAEHAAVTVLAGALHRAWCEPQRAYHTLQHLEECLVAFDAVQPQLQWPEAVLLALLFHDAIYEPERHDNEARSAEWAVDCLPRLAASPALTARVSALVMATHAHRPGQDDEQSDDTALLLDIDLSILGSEARRFAEYEQQIRREYGFVPETQYRQARAQVMRGFARRDPIFQTAHFRAALEAAAHRNLAAFA